jgi:hypothetical protein
MKTFRFLSLPAVIIIAIIPFISCTHKAETVVVPLKPLEGTYTGTTWQNKPVTLKIAFVDTGLFITMYDFYVRNDSTAGPDSILHLVRSSDNGIAPVVDNFFYVPVANFNADYESIQGTINPDNFTISGKIAVIFPAKPDTMHGNYSAVKQK